MGNEQSSMSLTTEEEEYHQQKGREIYQQHVDRAKHEAQQETRQRQEQAAKKQRLLDNLAEEERLRDADKLLKVQNEAWAAQQEVEAKDKSEATSTRWWRQTPNSPLTQEQKPRSTDATVSRDNKTNAKGTAEADVQAVVESRRLTTQSGHQDERNGKRAERMHSASSLAVRPSRSQVAKEIAPPVAKSIDDAVSDTEEDPLSSWKPRKQPRLSPSRSNNAPTGSKRAVPVSGFEDERRGSLQRGLKKPRVSVSSSGSQRSPQDPSDDGRRPPNWYKEMKIKNDRRRSDESGADISLQSLKDWIAKAKKAQKDADLQTAFSEVRGRLHRLAFNADINAQLLRNRGILSNENGLPQIFDDQYTGEVQWPYDIRADAEELYNKWCLRDFDIDLLRGIEQRRSGQIGGDSVKQGFQKNARFFGNGKLLNGQWWPTLICVFRDGAHGQTMRGVCGKEGEGAYSVFLSGGSDNNYPDIDHGDVVEYCGTDDEHRTSTIMPSTQWLLDGYRYKQPVRFIRSAKAKDKSAWAPVRGFRYDGLYDIKGYEVLDRELQRHRFKLVRRPGQGSIRGGNGPDSRPTKEEVEAYDKDKRLMKGA